jgi:membrane protease YdiL (CAAX protease family)
LGALFPSLDTVRTSPIEAFMRTPFEAAIFMVVVVLAGGVREELQRAFILHRFQQRLYGQYLGLVTFGLLFGALHWDQGIDVAIAIGLLGLMWGFFYIRRRSAVMSMANHAAFNAAQVAQHVIAKTFGL